MIKLAKILILLFFANTLFAKNVLLPDSLPSTLKWYQKEAFSIAATPTILLAYGISVRGNTGAPSSQQVYNFRQKNYPNFHTKVDDGLVFVPAAAIYGLNLLGDKGKNDLRQVSYRYIVSNLVGNAIMQPMKYIIKDLRPDGSANNSFPSGHTTMVFAAAEMLHQEYKDKSVWYGVAGYGVAVATGALRILNNRHWYSDVLAGAGIGIFSTKLTYWVFDKKYKKQQVKLL